MTVIENDSPKEFFEGPFEVSDLIPFTFPYADRTDVKVKIGDVVATYGEEYEVSAESPSSILVKVNIDDDVQVTVYRETPIDQQSNYPQNSKFRSEQVESDFDKICMIQQEQKETLTRCLRVPVENIVAFDGELPSPQEGKILVWSEEGKIINSPSTIAEIENSVNTAVTTSQTALTNSTGAISIAETAEQKSTTALSQSTSALSQSTSALADAASALSSATSAVATAGTANTTAASALAVANAAVQPGDNITKLVNNAGYITGVTWSEVKNKPSTFTPSAHTHTVSNITDFPNLATVATSGDYDDLTDKPTFSTGLTNTSGTITVTDYSKLLKNTATGSNALTIDGTATNKTYALNIGAASEARSSYGVALGTAAYGNASYATAVGYCARVTGNSSIQIGSGTTSAANQLYIGFTNANKNWNLLDGTTGLIPDARISSDIARTSAIPTNNNQLTNGAGYITNSAIANMQTTTNLVTSVSSSSTDSQYPSAKLFYDTCGDIEATINAIRGI